MCYYNGIKVSRKEYLRLKDIEASLKDLQHLLKPVISGVEYENAIVLVANSDRTGIEAKEMQWGFLPKHLKNDQDVEQWRYGFKDEKGIYNPRKSSMNAIGEEVLFKTKIYRQAALKRRCLLPSSNFYEWRHIFPIGKKGKPLQTAVKYPYYIGLKDKEYYYIAGIWQTWVNQESGELVDTFAILTTVANPLMKQIHNSKLRMPVILNDDLALEWVLQDLSEERIDQIAHYQIDWQEMIYYPVDKNFRSSEDPTKEAAYDDLPPIKVVA